jgi:hypothetical protein
MVEGIKVGTFENVNIDLGKKCLLMKKKGQNER